MTRRRITFTFARADVLAAVSDLALVRGCDPQDVINDVLARVLVDGEHERLRSEVRTLQQAIDLLSADPTKQHLPPAPMLPFPIPLEEPILNARLPRAPTPQRQNPWDAEG